MPDSEGGGSVKQGKEPETLNDVIRHLRTLKQRVDVLERAVRRSGTLSPYDASKGGLPALKKKGA